MNRREVSSRLADVVKVLPRARRLAAGRRSERGRLALATALIAVLGLLVLEPAVFGGQALTPDDVVYFSPPFQGERPPNLKSPSNPSLGDLTYLFEPHLLDARRQIRSGRLPTWDPYVSGGRPLGVGQGAPLYPLNWPAYVLPFWRSLGLIALLKLCVAGLGMMIFTRALGVRWGPALLAGVAFPLGTMFVAWLGHGQADVVGLLPWTCFLAGRLAQRGSWADVALLGITGGLTLYGGHPESAIVVGLGTCAFFGHRLRVVARVRRRESAMLVGRVAMLAAAGLVALLVGGLMLVPLAELAGQSSHLAKVQGRDSLSQLAAGLAFPEAWGRADKTVFAAGDASTVSSVFAGRAYIGVAPVLFIAAALVGVMADRRVRFLLAVCAACLLLMLDGPVHSVATHLPLLSLVGLHQFIWLAFFALVALAALGLDAWMGAAGRTRRRMLAAMAVAAGAPLLLALTLHLGALHAWRSGLAQFPVLHRVGVSANAAQLGSMARWAVLSLVVLAILVLGTRRPARLALCVGALVAVTACDLVTLDRGYQPHVPVAIADPATPGSITLARRAPVAGRLVGVNAVLSPNLAERLRAFDARGEDLPGLRRYLGVWSALGGDYLPGFGETLLDGSPARYQRLLDVFGVRYVLDDGGPSPTSLHPIYAGPDGRLLENSTAFPPAWLAYGWRGLSSFAAARSAVGATPPAGLLRTPVIERIASHPSAAASEPVPVLRPDEESVELHVHAVRAAELILNDLYYPGWSATVDGHPARIRAANGAFRAVALAAGAHLVRFAYRPRSVLLGAVAVGGGLLIALALLVTAGLGRRRRSEHAQAVAGR